MKFLTTGIIAKELNADRDAVAYAIRKTEIEPVGRAGIVRLFPCTALARVKKFLHSKGNKKRVAKCAH